MAGILQSPISSATPAVRGYWVSFAYSFVYDNGFESGITEFTPPIYADGRKYIRFTSIPTGPSIGGQTCVKRRIWQWVNFTGPTLLAGATGQGQSFGSAGAGGVSACMIYAEILDNTTGGFIASSDPLQVSATSDHVNVRTPAQPGTLRSLPNVVTPAGPSGPITACVLEPAAMKTFDPGFDALATGASFFNPSGGFQPDPSFSIVPTVSHFIRYSWVYANGVESNWSPSACLSMFPTGGTLGQTGLGVTTLGALSTQFLGVNLSGGDPEFGGMVFLSTFMPLFKGMQNAPTLNGVPGIGMIIYMSTNGDNWVPGSYLGMVVVPSNSVAATGYQPQFYNTCGRQIRLSSAGSSANGTGSSGTLPVWPNPDGPSLETDPPDDLTDTNTDLLKVNPLKVTLDLTQVRNRIHVMGAGTTLTDDIAAGATQVFVKDVTVFARGSGQLILDGMLVQLVGAALTSLGDNSGYIILGSGVSRAVTAGSTVVNYLKVDDPKSQAALGAIEFDRNGVATDGVHEYTIQDGSLVDNFGMFMAANAQLEVFSQPVQTITYSTLDAKSKVGQFVKANLSNPPCVGTFLIQSVTIDQIHDESDQVGARYNVTATTAKFTLDDLLLQISPRAQSGGGGVGGGGASVASASSSNGDTQVTPSSLLDQLGSDQGTIVYRDIDAWKVLEPGGPGQVLQTNGPNANPTWVTPAGASIIRINDLYRNTGRMFILQATSPGNGSFGQSIGYAAGGSSGSVSANSKTSSMYAKLTGLATLNSYTGAASPNAAGGLWTDDQDFVADFQIATDVVITNVRFLIGMGNSVNSAPVNADVQSGLGSGGRMFFIRYSDAVPDPGWVGCVWDGTSQQTTGSLASVAASTEYALRIRKVGTSIFFSVNGGAESTLVTSTLSSKVMNPFFGMYNTIASSRIFSYSHMVISVGGPFF